MQMMTPRERLAATLRHETPDRVCVDFGAGFQTGLGVGAIHRLRTALFGKTGPVKVIESYQMLGEIDEELRQALGLDVVGVHGAGNSIHNIQSNVPTENILAMFRARKESIH